MNRQGGPTHMKLGNFPPSTTAAGRGALANGRLVGAASGWSAVAPPPGVPTPTTRPSSTMNYSGTLNAHLDMSEFPALGGQPSTNSAQTWGRLSTQSPSQSRAPPGHPPPPNEQPQQDRFTNKDIFSGIDDFSRIGGSVTIGGGNVGQTAQRQGQLPPSTAEDFPALPRSQQTMGQLEDRGMGMGVMSVHRGSIGGSRLIPQELGGIMSDVEKKDFVAQSLATNGAPGLSNTPLGLPQSLALPQSSPDIGVPAQLQQIQQKFLNKEEFDSNQTSSEPLNIISESDQYKFEGLLSIIRSENTDAFTVGTDLTQLGLDLNQPDLPLWPMFASPFAELDAKAVEPDYHLPQCYTVHNTQPVSSKMGNFSDETLFYIFYTMPRDIMQELVVQELAARNWRYHMVHKLWVTKDDSVRVEPISDQAERGVYIFFDPTTWERIRKEIVLEYVHLDPRTTGTYTGLQGHMSFGGLS